MFEPSDADRAAIERIESALVDLDGERPESDCSSRTLELPPGSTITELTVELMDYGLRTALAVPRDERSGTADGDATGDDVDELWRPALDPVLEALAAGIERNDWERYYGDVASDDGGVQLGTFERDEDVVLEVLVTV